MARQPKVSVSVVERDFGLKHILAEAQKLKRKPFVKVGIRGKSALKPKLRSDGTGDATLNLVDVATIHEYGSESPKDRPPQRSFLRSTVDKFASKYNEAKDRLIDEILDPKKKMTTQKALRLLGELVQSDVRQTIRNRIPPKLSVNTIEAKTRASGAVADIPLIDTGQLINGISYHVEMDGRKDTQK